MQPTRFERILVCWDGGGKDIVTLAGRVAAASKAAIRIIACLPEPSAYRKLDVPNFSELADLTRDARERQLSMAAKRLEARGLQADWVISNSPGEEGMARELASRTYDLIMVAAQKQGTVYAAPRSTVQLMRGAPCPVWVVRPGRVGSSPRVLAAVAGDGPEDLNARLLLTANSLATHLGGELHVLSVWNAYGESMLRGPRFASIDADDVRRYFESARDDCAQSLATVVTRCQLVLAERRTHLIKGDPLSVIPEFCHRNQITTLVMGTVARRGLSAVLLGNTAERVAQALPASILSVGSVFVGRAAAEDGLAVSMSGAAAV